MGGQQTAAKLAKVRPEVTIVPIETLTGRGPEVHEMVRKRAYELFLARGREAGHENDDWKQAESELTRRIPVGIMEEENSLINNADFAGCGVKKIQVAIQRQRLVISGPAESTDPKANAGCDPSGDPPARNSSGKRHRDEPHKWNARIEVAKGLNRLSPIA